MFEKHKPLFGKEGRGDLCAQRNGEKVGLTVLRCYRLIL
jgi:hypothetical protein